LKMNDLIKRLRYGASREASGKSALWDPIMSEAADALEQAKETEAINDSEARLANKRIEELEAALETLARLGNGNKYGNSDGNIIAQKALAKVLDHSPT